MRKLNVLFAHFRSASGGAGVYIFQFPLRLKPEINRTPDPKLIPIVSFPVIIPINSEITGEISFYLFTYIIPGPQVPG